MGSNPRVSPQVHEPRPVSCDQRTQLFVYGFFCSVIFTATTPRTGKRSWLGMRLSPNCTPGTAIECCRGRWLLGFQWNDVIIMLSRINGDETGQIPPAESAFSIFSKVNCPLHPLRDFASWRRAGSSRPAKLSESAVKRQEDTAVTEQTEQQMKYFVRHLYPISD